MADDKLRVTMRISKDTKDKLDMIQSKLETTQGETLEALLEAFTKVPDLSVKELKELDDALDNSKLSVAEIVKRGLLTEVRKINALAKKANLEDMALADLKQPANRFKGVAEERIKREVALIMEHNNNQSEPQARLCLTKSLIARRTGSNRPAVNEYFDKHKVMIDDHNSKFRLTQEHNRKSTGEDFLSPI